MNPIKDLIEKKRKKPIVKFNPLGTKFYLSPSEKSYNQALDDLANDPTFYKSLEDGLVEYVNKMAIGQMSKEEVNYIITSYFKSN